MSFTLFSKPTLSGRIKRSRWLRGAMVIGLAFTVSACAYDSPYYSSRSSYSSYSGGHHGYYDRGHYHRDRYSKRPDWRAHARHRQIQRRQHAEIQRHRMESRQRFERRRHHEARKHRSSAEQRQRTHRQHNRAERSRPRQEHRRHR